MILRFSVSNFRSIRSEQTISFVADRAIKDETTHLLATPAVPSGNVLPALLVYGANASGKSALIQAMAHFRQRISSSFFQARPENAPTQRYAYFAPFALDDSSINEPSTFELDFTVEQTRYNYGFSIQRDLIDHEWLYFYPKGTKARLFVRNGSALEFGDTFGDLKSEIKNLISARPDSLVMSVGIQLKHRQLVEINRQMTSYALTTDRLQLSSSDTDLAFHTDALLHQLVVILKHLGTGISGFLRKSRKETPLDRQYIRRPGSAPGEVEYVEFCHDGASDKNYALPLTEESAGTKHLIRIMRTVLYCIDNGLLVAADELDTSLHSQAADAILALFGTPAINSRGSQILATTHNTNLMMSDCFRRDQLWFVEKNRLGESHLYPLTDFATRKDMNLEKGYLQGRFGATPFVDRSTSLSAMISELKATAKAFASD